MSMQDSAPQGWKPVKAAAFMELIGPLLRSTKLEGKNTYGLQTNDRHNNPIGLVHGGVLTSLLDHVVALAAWNAAGRVPTVTIQMDTQFLGAAKSGDFLEARASIRHLTRSLVFIDAEVFCANGPIASASAILKILQKSGQSK